MKTRIYLMAAALLCGIQHMTAQTEGQPAGEKQGPTQEQMNKMRATKVANVLMLDEATTTKFIPIYENYLKEMAELNGKNGQKQPCCGQRPEGRKGCKKGPAPDGKDAPAPDGKVCPMGGKGAPEGQGAPDGKGAPAPDGKVCPMGGNANEAPKALTDAEVEQAFKDRIARLRKKADIQEKYYKEFRTILTPLQTARVMKVTAPQPKRERR